MGVGVTGLGGLGMKFDHGLVFGAILGVLLVGVCMALMDGRSDHYLDKGLVAWTHVVRVP